MDALERDADVSAVGDVAGDLLGVEAAVFDEPAARGVATANRAGEVDNGPAGLERRGVEDRGSRRIAIPSTDSRNV